MRGWRGIKDTKMSRMSYVSVTKPSERERARSTRTSPKTAVVLVSPIRDGVREERGGCGETAASRPRRPTRTVSVRVRNGVPVVPAVLRKGESARQPRPEKSATNRPSVPRRPSVGHLLRKVRAVRIWCPSRPQDDFFGLSDSDREEVR